MSHGVCRWMCGDPAVKRYLRIAPRGHTAAIRPTRSRNSHCPIEGGLLISVAQKRGVVDLETFRYGLWNSNLFVWVVYREYLSPPLSVDAKVHHRLYSFLKTIFCKAT